MMMASYDDRERIYHKGYRDGFKDGYREAQGDYRDFGEGVLRVDAKKLSRVSKPKPRKQSAKQKLLTQLTDKKWKQYRKGSGKKTYIEIRAQVSRSQDYKRKAKRLK